jgi:hypothetical protein
MVLPIERGRIMDGGENVQAFFESDDGGVAIHSNDLSVTSGTHTYLFVRDFHFASRFPVTTSRVATCDPPT